MKVSIGLHAFNTWLVAHLVHPAVFLVWMVFNDAGVGADDVFMITLIAWFFGFLYSLPVLFTSMLFIWCIMRLPVHNPDHALLIWMTAAVFSILACGYLVLGGNGIIDWTGLHLMVPAVVAVVIAILIRLRQWRELFISWKPAEITNENQRL